MVLDQKASAPPKYLVRFQHVNHHPVLNSYRVLAVGGVVQIGSSAKARPPETRGWPGSVLCRLRVMLVRPISFRAGPCFLAPFFGRICADQKTCLTDPVRLSLFNSIDAYCHISIF